MLRLGTVLLILSYASCVIGQEEATFPQIPSQYSATVVASFSDLGYTLAYTEYYDSLLGKSRTDGRMTFTHVREYIDWSTGTLYHYNGTFCGVYALPQNAMDLPLYSPSSSMWFFKLAEEAWDNGEVQILDDSTTDRGILCRVFEIDKDQPATADNGFIRTQTTYTLYFSANSDQPISVFVSGASVNESNPNAVPQTYTHIYDWVNWVSVNQSTSVFELPAICRMNPIAIDERPLFTLPNQSAVIPEPAPGSLEAPTIPSEFSMVLETVLEDDSDVVDSVVWQFDSRIQQDRVDYEVSGREYDIPTAYIVHYNTSYYPGASVYYSTADNDALACYSDADKTHLSPLTLSPLAKIHAGAVPELFSGSFVRNHSYIGRRDVRGVSADVFRANLVRTRNGVTYSLQEDLFFFPSGWKFPGVPLAQYSEQLPMHIEVFGRFVDGDGVQQSYNETWNFFLLIPVPPDSSVFDPAPLGCDILKPETLLEEVKETVLSPLVIFIIAVLSILGGGSACYWWRSKRLKARFAFSHEGTPDPSSAPTPTNALKRANETSPLPKSRSHHSLLTPHALASDDQDTHIELASPMSVYSPTAMQGVSTEPAPTEQPQ